MIYLGCDPGVTGGWAVLDKEGEVLASYKFESISAFKAEMETLTDTWLIRGCVEESTLPMIFNMKTKSFMPRKGSQEYKRQVGKWEGALEALGVSHELVRPQKWQKMLLGDVPKGKTKEYALSYAQKKWPHLNLKKKDDGIVDALCIAEYCRRVHLTGSASASVV